MGQKYAQKDERGVWTYFSYDSMYRLTQQKTVTSSGNFITSYTYDAAGNKKTATDPMGTVTTYEYDEFNRLISESVPNPNGGTLMTTYEYGNNCGNDVFSDTGFLPTKVTDPAGNYEEFAYDGAYRLISKKRNGELLFINTYDQAGNIVSKVTYNSTGSGNQQAQQVYDLQNRMTSSTAVMSDGTNLTTQFQYDVTGNKIATIDPEGHSTQTVYDGAGRAVKEIINLDDTISDTPSASDIVSLKEYDDNGNLTKATLVNDTGSGNQITEMTYDAQNRLLAVTDALENSESYKYDLAGNKTQVTDKRGNITTMTYDDLNRLLTTTLPQVYDAESAANVTPQTSQTYDNNNNILTQTDARGLVTENTYDTLNRLTQTTVKASSGDIITTYTYDKVGNKLTETFQRGDQNQTSTYTYDDFNRVLTVTDPGNYTESYTYDIVGNKLTATDKRGNTTTFEYDLANRMVKTILPEVTCSGSAVSPTTETVYLKNGWVSSIIDANNKTITTAYDAAGRKTSITNAASEVTSFTYDKAGNILTQTVGNSSYSGDQVTTMTYDLLNRQLTETLNSGDSSYERIYSYTYDANGNKLSQTLPSGDTTTYTYDALNRLLTQTYSDTTQNRTYTYNKNGAVVKATDITGSTNYTYDDLGRIITEIKLDTSDNEISTVTSGYDKAGNRTSVTYPGSRSLTFTYDARNLLSTITDGTAVTTYGYDENGNRTSLTLPNGTVTTTTFDAANRVTSIANMTSGVNTYTAAYTMDAVGTRMEIDETRANASSRILTYTYDNVYRLLSETDAVSGGTPTTTTYTYDDAGNRITKEENGTAYSYTVDKLNRVTAYNDSAGTAIATYTYDANGNRLTKTQDGVIHTYTYDLDNRLLNVNDGTSDIFTASYDYRTRRYQKVENGATTRYIYDGGVNIQEYSIDSTGQSSLTKQLIRGTGMGGGIGSVLYDETVDSGSVSKTEYFSYNAIGSTMATLNASNTLTSTNYYDAFGNVVDSTGDSDNNRKFCTKERSASIGLDNFGMRYFDPILGRFIQRDPAGYPDGPNNYLYCHNNPINFVDPLGLMTESQFEEKFKKKYSNHDKLARKEVDKLKKNYQKQLGKDGYTIYSDDFSKVIQESTRSKEDGGARKAAFIIRGGNESHPEDRKLFQRASEYEIAQKEKEGYDVNILTTQASDYNYEQKKTFKGRNLSRIIDNGFKNIRNLSSSLSDFIYMR